MTQEDKQLLLKDLCARLPHGVKYRRDSWNFEWDQEMTVVEVMEDIDKEGYINYHKVYKVDDIKPYLRPLSSMTKEEAIELAELGGFKNILSVKVNQYHIIVEVDDGVCSSERHIIWFNEIVLSIGILDWLLKNHFDFRGLIELGLALPAPDGMYDN